MRRFSCILTCFLAFSALCGCAVLRHGNDLAAFAARLRERDKSVDAAERWFYDENERRLRRFSPSGRARSRWRWCRMKRTISRSCG